jgi:hypothetical protein
MPLLQSIEIRTELIIRSLRAIFSVIRLVNYWTLEICNCHVSTAGYVETFEPYLHVRHHGIGRIGHHSRRASGSSSYALEVLVEGALKQVFLLFADNSLVTDGVEVVHDVRLASKRRWSVHWRCQYWA